MNLPAYTLSLWTRCDYIVERGTEVSGLAPENTPALFEKLYGRGGDWLRRQAKNASAASDDASILRRDNGETMVVEQSDVQRGFNEELKSCCICEEHWKY